MESGYRHATWRPNDAHLLAPETTKPAMFRKSFSGKEGASAFSLVTMDPRTLPPESTWYVMTNLEGKIEKTVGNTYGLRTWIEYGFKHAKNELGWAEYQATDYASIERWWELVFSAYSLVSFQCLTMPCSQEASEPPEPHEATPLGRFPEHPWWDAGHGWKNTLNNFRLILQPYICSCLLLPWLLVFDIPRLRAVFAELTGIMNLFHASLPT